MEDISKSLCVSLLDGSIDISVSSSVIVYTRCITEETLSESFVGVEELLNETIEGYITPLNSFSNQLKINKPI